MLNSCFLEFLKRGGEKMKNAITLLVLAGIALLLVCSTAFAGTSTGNITVKAVIAAGTPDMSYEIHKTTDGDPDHNVWTNYTSATDLTFDVWDIVQRTGKSAQWVSITQNTVIVWASGRGDDYQITATGTGSLTGAGGTLPDGSLMCNPIYSSTDEWWEDIDGDGVKDAGETYQQGSQPSGSTLGSEGKILGGGSVTVYQSEQPVGSPRILQVQFMFPAYNIDGSTPYTNYAPIPSSQAAGTYQGATVKVAIAAR
jgi:hypothetical protein